MNILQIGNIDTFGRRFNGTDLITQIQKNGHQAEGYFWEKQTENKHIHKFSSFFRYKRVLFRANNLERRFSIQSLLTPFSFFLIFKKFFLKADVVHYHLIHTGYFNLLALPILSRLRPMVWTLHDPWAMTGHCIYPFDCKKWKTMCENCPDLKTQLPMEKDHTKFMWKIKKFIYKHSKLNIVVASEWMFDMVKSSPLLQNSKINLIPFGLNLKLYKPADQKKAKEILKISKNNFVLFFRAGDNIYKGQKYILESLKKIKSKKSITIITAEHANQFKVLNNKIQIIDLGWTHDEKILINAYNACDVFLMPSTAEAFGLMAIEAMACGKPVITFKGTSVEKVIFTPQGGIAVEMKNSNELGKAIIKLIENPDLKLKIGKQALEIVKNNYNETAYISKLIKLYSCLIYK